MRRRLVIKLNRLGDVVVLQPTLRAIASAHPGDELHVLVPAEAAPLLFGQRDVTRVWAYERRRGRAGLGAAWPMLRALRRLRFEASLDLVGNDRGALLGLVIGARVRQGLRAPKGFAGRRLCYHRTHVEVPRDVHETRRDLAIAQAAGLARGGDDRIELHADPALVAEVRPGVPEGALVVQATTSQPKKDWPVEAWVAWAALAGVAEERLVFLTGASARERAVRERLREALPRARHPEPVPSLGHYVAVVALASVVVTADTVAVHVASGLGRPVVAIFGPTDPAQWGPRGELAAVVRAPRCGCRGEEHACSSAEPCMAAVSPEAVAAATRRWVAGAAA